MQRLRGQYPKHALIGNLKLVRFVQQMRLTAFVGQAMATRDRNISLRGLRTFCVAAGYESFREAAERLHVTASAISHQIKNLEEELGFKLFERGARSLSLTSRGRALFRETEPLIRDIEKAMSRHAVPRVGGTLRLSLQAFFASELFMSHMTELSAGFPELDIEIDTVDEFGEKHAASADISVRVFRKAPAGLKSDKLFGVRLIAVGSPDLYSNIKLVGKKVTSELPLIVYGSRPDAWQLWQRSAGITFANKQKDVRFDSIISAVRAAEQGVGAVLVPVQLIDSRVGAGKLVPLFDHEFVTRDSLYIVCRDDDSDRHEVAAVREWLLQKFENFA